MPLQLKRVYDPPEATDGERLLVDRLWPRGLRQEAAQLHGWLKDLAPSPELRRWFAHDPQRWPEFQARYRAELRAPEKEGLIRDLAQKASRGRVTLLFAARDPERNNAVVLKEVIEQAQQEMARPADTAPLPGKD